MGESTKAFLALIMIVGIFAAAMAWSVDRPDAATWGWRIGGIVAVVLALAIFLKLHFRADLAPDYLREITSNYFNRDGFCFALVAKAVDGCGYINAYFQSQRDRPSIGRVAIRPARGFFLTRSPIEAILFVIECPPAGFGVARIAVPIPEELQGKRLAFDVGATVKYPHGRGRMVRFRDGVCLRQSHRLSHWLEDAALAAGTVLLSAAVHIPIPSKAKWHLDLPVGVATELTDKLRAASQPDVTILWKLKQPPLDEMLA